MAEDTEALKHNFFFRGFFKRRGYYNLTDLKSDQYRHDKVFANPENHREWLTTEDLFQPASNGLETLSLAGRKRIDAVATQLGDSLAAGSIVVEGYSATQDHEEQFVLSRNRAILVSQYLHTRFHLDSQNIGVVSLEELPPPGLHKDKWDGVCMVILK
jgi:phospholipid/cholesterol/gamma-HCH transport system substrate-binding protein